MGTVIWDLGFGVVFYLVVLKFEFFRWSCFFLRNFLFYFIRIDGCCGFLFLAVFCVVGRKSVLV